jgi:WD40 repeat protein
MGTNLRYMRVFDLRYYTTLKTTRPSINFLAHNKGVLGICFNPFDSNLFASYSEDGQVKLWDIRKLPNVLRELPISNKRDPGIAQIEWSPSSRNVLGVLMRYGCDL